MGRQEATQGGSRRARSRGKDIHVNYWQASSISSLGLSHCEISFGRLQVRVQHANNLLVKLYPVSRPSLPISALIHGKMEVICAVKRKCSDVRRLVLTDILSQRHGDTGLPNIASNLLPIPEYITGQIGGGFYSRSSAVNRMHPILPVSTHIKYSGNPGVSGRGVRYSPIGAKAGF